MRRNSIKPGCVWTDTNGGGSRPMPERFFMKMIPFTGTVKLRKKQTVKTASGHGGEVLLI